MRKRTIENIGAVEVSDITLCDTEIGLYIPIEKLSGNTKEKYEECKENFTNRIRKNFPDLDWNNLKFVDDIALHIYMFNSKVSYSIQIILLAEDENGEEIDEEFSDRLEVEINAEDNKYLKKLVMNKLMDSFF